MAETQACCVVDRQPIEVGRRHPADVCRFLALAQCSIDYPAAKADVELLTDFAVAVFDEVTGVAVDADDAVDLDVETGLLAGLADRGLADALAQLHDAAGKRPEVVV